MHSSYTKKVSAADGATYNYIETKRDIVIEITDIKIFFNDMPSDTHAC
jgi:hypothetical protein